MESGVNVAKPAQLDARVDLGCGDGSVSQQFLHDPEIGAPGKKMGGKAVPERVRTDIAAQAGRPGMAFDDLPEGNP
jgi:hypothetical protein